MILMIQSTTCLKRLRFNLLDHLKQLHVEFTLESKMLIKIDQIYCL